ncbi:MAG: MFS transporter [Deltaproteobacteria bacterium]|nr:MFS transporter [Deltaproteobacteria bacterium]MBW2395792.1 MFS transporter [Deltaproteobacteria bacterium]
MTSRRTLLGVVFTTILIDFVGFSVLIPVLPLYASRLGATPVQVGLILAVYALTQLLFLPFWGWVSDRLGRRPVLLVSLFGTAASFVLLALAGELETVYLARALAGFFAASVGTAQAVVTDLTPPSERASGMGLIGAAFGAGMIMGPMLGGGLATFHEQAPFYAVAILAAANGVLALFVLDESRPAELTRPRLRDLGRSLIPAPVRLLFDLRDRRVGLFLLLFFVFFSAFSVLEAMITLYLGTRFGADELDAALIFGWIGIFLVLTQALLLRRLMLFASEFSLVVAGLALMAVGLLAVPLAPSYGWFYAIGPFIAVGNGLAFPAFTSLYSQVCRAEEAGELLGQSNSMGTAGRIVGAWGGGQLMATLGLGAPFWAAGALMVAALVLFIALRHQLLPQTASPASTDGSETSPPKA